MWTTPSGWGKLLTSPQRAECMVAFRLEEEGDRMWETSPPTVSASSIVRPGTHQVGGAWGEEPEGFMPACPIWTVPFRSAPSSSWIRAAMISPSIRLVA